MRHVYLLCDPRIADSIKRVRYVGISRSPYQRHASHLAAPRTAKAPPRHREWIAELLAANLHPQMELVTSNLSEAEVIARYRSAGADLTNRSKGSKHGLAPSEEDGSLLGRMCAERVITRRRERGFTQEELARLAGVLRQQIGKLETGEHIPHIDTVQKLAKALKCKAGWLVYGDEK